MKMTGNRWIQTNYPGGKVQTSNQNETVEAYQSQDVAEVQHDSKSYFYDVECISDDEFIGFIYGAFCFEELEIMKDYDDQRMVVVLN